MSSLGVQSVPELYGLLLGFQYYDRTWDLLVKTGVAFVPFISLIITHSVDLMMQTSQAAQAVPLSIRRLSVDSLICLLVIMLACVPCMPLQPHYNLSTNQHTGTTFDHTLALTPQHMTTVKVPLWWYGVMAVSEGITQALRQPLTKAISLRTLITTVHLTTVHDPLLRRQLQQFYRQCYLPAHHKWVTAQRQTTVPIRSSLPVNLIQPQSADDTHWLGSHRLLATPGYYDQFYAEQPVPGFAFHPETDWPQAQLGQKPQWGQPSCKAWWQDSDYGLQAQLVAQLPHGTFSQLKEALLGKYPAWIDQVTQSLLRHTGYKNPNRLVGEVSYGHVAEVVGVMKNTLTSYPKLYAVLQAAPLIRGLLLLLFYALLPFALVGSRYRLKALLAGSTLLFSLIAWSYLWQLIQWLDQALIQALYGTGLFQYTPQAFLADSIIGLLMILAPFFWFTLMGVFGLAVGQGAERALMTLSGSASAAGEAGGQAVTRSVATGIRFIR